MAEWFDDYADEEDELQIDEYDITATPNDFNVSTLFNFIESGAVGIPESLILGIPVPQLFLYEQARNRFLVIDGQQRLMSIYYFVKRKFPRKEKRVEIRAIFDKEGKVPDEILHDDEFFEDFKLKLSEKLPNHVNKFHGLNYSTLGDYKTQFDLRPIRNIIVKQNSPAGDDILDVRGFQPSKHRWNKSSSPRNSNEHVPFQILRHALPCKYR